MRAWNHASEKVYGYTAQEALGANLLDLIIPPALRRQVEQAVRLMFETGQDLPPGRLTLRHKDGHAVPVYSSHTIPRWTAAAVSSGPRPWCAGNARFAAWCCPRSLRG